MRKMGITNTYDAGVNVEQNYMSIYEISYRDMTGLFTQAYRP